MAKNTPTIGCVVVTLNALDHLSHCLLPLLQSPLKPRVLVVDSSSTDGTIEIAKTLGAETLVIPRGEFNHGSTREKARCLLATDIICMHTQDAYFIDNMALGKMVAPILENKAQASYARQIPHPEADFFEAFARSYNYGSESHIRGIDDVDKYGVYTFFCSDSCAAYSNRALDEVGGFPTVLLGEDTVAVAKLLRKGYKIAYEAEALVRHSHRYSLSQEFKRSFDTGIARMDYQELLKCNDSDSKRGMDYVQKMMKQLIKEAPHRLPYAFANVFSRWLGYRIGQKSVNAPSWFKRALSSQPYYWK